jgi:hypothetical protein
MSPRWYLYCDSVFIHSTDDDDLAARWTEVDPGGHVASTEPPVDAGERRLP